MNLNNKKVHLIGIGGICISGIAKILIKKGCIISGSDLIENDSIKSLKKLGAKIYKNHSSENINKNIDFIIHSSAISSNNIEIITAKLLNINIISRGKILNYLINTCNTSISISGTHGKTTTTSILISIFKNNNLNPTFINGGIIKNINYNSNLGKNNFFIIESDESDLSFLELNPNIIVITNIDDDHIRSYNNDIEILKNSFINFSNRIKKNGFIIACIDDNNVKDIIPKIKNKIYTYGFNKNSDVIISNYHQDNFYNYFNIFSKKINININIKLKNIIGKHNALNATAAIIVSIKNNLSLNKIINSLLNFNGVCNRIENLGKYNIYYSKNKIIKNILFISDYGHHPIEINNNIITIKKLNYNKLIMVFQPHRFTRTYDLKEKFIKVLYKIDFLILLDIYSASENNKIISGFEFFNLIKLKKKKNIIYCSDNKYILKNLLKNLQNNDLVLFQGAGNIHNIARKFLKIKKFKLI